MQKKRKKRFAVIDRLKKMWLLMRLCIILLLGFITQVSAEGVAQVRISLQAEQITFREIFAEINRQTGYTVVYNNERLNRDEALSVDFQHAELTEVLKALLTGKGLTFELMDEFIILSARSVLPQRQERTVSGKVTDQQGVPLPGVTVLIKGTKAGTATGPEGRYSLTLPEQENLTLVFTMIGMQDREEIIGKRTVVDVKMKEKVNELNDVVVTGYFNQAKNSFTGAARTISADELQMGSNQNILTALQNIDPSFMKLENNTAGSNPNALPDFQIRGAGSLTGMQEEYSGSPNMPVFILDGFEVSAEKVFDMDTYKVNTITILKDAAATAVYGSRASNGVVVITTKVPENGKMQISYSMDATFYMPDLNGYDLLNAREKLEIERRAGMFRVTRGMSSVQDLLDEDYNKKLMMVAKGYDTYWLDKPLYKLITGHKHSLMLDGGNEYIRYALELNYNNTPGVMKESGRKRTGIGMKLQYTYKNVVFKNYLTYAHVKSEESPYGQFSTYARLNPYARYKDEQGNYTYLLDEDNRSNLAQSNVLKQYNPLFNTTLNTVDESLYDDFTNNFGIDWTIWEGLRLKGDFSITRQNTGSDDFKPAKHTDFATWTGDRYDRKGAYIATRGEQMSYDGNAIITYFCQKNKHVINANAGFNVQQSRMKEFRMKVEGFPDENLDDPGFALQYEEKGTPKSTEYTSRLIGFLGNLNYSYDERYLMDLSFREDASSRFGADNRWAPFWSAGMGWNLHREKWLHSVRFINRLKIRASYGHTGSQDYNPYQAITTYRYQSGERYRYNYGAEVMAMGNENLGWQKTAQQNYGLDIDLWNERVNFYGNYYIKTSKDLLVAVTLPPSLGFDSYMDNLGEVENRGYELSLRVSPVRSPEKRIFWSLHVSAIHNANKVKKISNALKAYNQVQDKSVSDGRKEPNRPKVRYIEGKSMHSIWVNQSLGIDPATGYELFLTPEGEISSEWSAANYVIGGCEDSDLEGNFGTNLNIKGFQLNMIFRYRLGGELYNQTLIDRVQDADLRYNVDRRVFEERWQKPGDVTRFTNFGSGMGNANVGQLTRPTSRFVGKWNYLELATLNLAYEFKPELTRRTGIQRLKVLFYMNDVFRTSTVKQERGIEYPFARNFSVGLQAGF